MPHLVARRWQTLKGPHTAIRALCRPQRTTRPALTATLRAYAQQATPRSKAFHTILPLNSAIIIPGSVKDAQPDVLVKFINPVAHENVNKDTFCVLLVTPSFAPWLLNDEALLTKAIRRAYSNAFTGRPGRLTIHALCAVVDKLPAGRALERGVTLDSEVIRRASEPPVGDTGYEGIAFITLPATSSVPSTSPKSSDKGAIDFVLSGKTVDESTFHDTWRLPLANTVFQTGSPATMHLSRWGLLSERRFLGLEQKTNISHHGISLTAADETAGCPISVLSIPLQPLTWPRQVEGCMGNIIRRIVGPDRESITASSELEKVVPQFFKARGEPPQPTTAWALVMPKSLKGKMGRRTFDHLSRRLANKEEVSELGDVLWERLWRSDPTAWNKLVPWAIAEGARLHRVLSGGGGWGKKAGLLSLDPVPVSGEVPIRMEDATSGFDGPGDFSTALTPVVQDGDAIQFFISPTPINTKDMPEHDELQKLKSMPKESTWGWELGTIPSTVDSIPGGSWQHTGSESKYVAVFRHSFGALAEEGMTLTRRLHVTPGQPLSTLATTTIDVPYSRFWSIEVVGKEGPAQDSINSCQYESAKNVLVRATRQRVPNPQQNFSPHSSSNYKVMVRSPSSIEAISLSSDRLAQTITCLTDEHAVIMRTLNNRQRRIKVRKARRDEKKFPPHRNLYINTYVDLTESTPLLGTLQALDEPVVSLVVRRVPDSPSEKRKDIKQVLVRKIVSQPRSRPTIDIDQTAEKARRQGKEIARLTEQFNMYASVIRQRTTRIAPVRTFVSREKGILAARSFDKEQVWLRYIEKEVERLNAQYRIIASKARARKREQIEWHQVTLEEGSLQQNQQCSFEDFYQRMLKGSRSIENVIRTLETRFQVLVKTMKKRMKKHMKKILQRQISATKRNPVEKKQSVDKVAQYSKEANIAAAEVYSSHISLRLRIGKMIFYRQKGRKQILGIRKLESRLLELRDFDGVLFHDRPEVASGNIKDMLGNTELKSEIQRSLVINTPEGIAQRRRRLVAEQRRDMRKYNDGIQALTRSRLRRLRPLLVDRKRQPAATQRVTGLRFAQQQRRNSDKPLRPRVKRVLGPSPLEVRKHVTIPPHWRRKGVREQSEFRAYLVNPYARKVLSKIKRRSGRRRPSKASGRKSGSKNLIDTIGSWLS